MEKSEPAFIYSLIKKPEKRPRRIEVLKKHSFGESRRSPGGCAVPGACTPVCKHPLEGRQTQLRNYLGGDQRSLKPAPGLLNSVDGHKPGALFI